MAQMLVLVISGVGVNGALPLVSTHGLTAALRADIATQLGAASAYTAGLITAIPSRGYVTLGVLDPLGSDGGVTLEITAADGQGQAARGELDYERGTPVLSTSGDAVRLAAAVTAAATTWTVTDGASVGSGVYRWLGDEVVYVSGQVGDTLTVVRGRMGTTAQPHAVGIPGPVLWERRPTLAGASATLYAGTVGATALSALTAVWRGVCGTASTDGGPTLSLPLSSAWHALTAATWEAERGDTVSTISIQRTGPAELRVVGQIWVDETASRGGAWTHAHIIGDESDGWVCYEVSDSGVTVSRVEIDGVEHTYRRYDEGDIVAAGVGPRLIDVHDPAWSPWRIGDEPERCRAEQALVATASGDVSIGALVRGVLTGSLPSGAAVPVTMSARIPDDQIVGGTLAEIDDAIGAGPNCSAGLCVPPYSGSIAAWLSDEVLRPLGLAISVGSDGRLRAVDWRQSLTVDHTITDTDLARHGYQSSHDTASAVRRVVIESETGTDTIVSDVARELYAGAGREVSLSLGLLHTWRDAVRDRWVSTLLVAHEVGSRVVQLQCRDTVDAQPGETVDVQVTQIPRESGAVGTNTGRRGVVLSSSVAEVDGVASVTIALVRELGDGGEWGPACEVDGAQASSTTITVHAGVYTSGARDYATDAEALLSVTDAGGAAYVWLLDQYGTRRDDNAPKLTSHTATTVTLSSVFSSSGSPLALVDGDVVVLADYDTTEHGDYAWWADDAGTLGAGGDDGQIYE